MSSQHYLCLSCSKNVNKDTDMEKYLAETKVRTRSKPAEIKVNDRRCQLNETGPQRLVLGMYRKSREDPRIKDIKTMDEALERFKTISGAKRDGRPVFPGPQPVTLLKLYGVSR